MPMNNMILNEYGGMTADPTFRTTAEQLVYKFGMRADLKGSNYLIDAVILNGTDSCTHACEIYRIIGSLRELNSKTVMRDITYTVKHAFGLADKLSAALGITIPESDIHSSLVIAYLGRLFKNPHLYDYR